MTSPALPRLTAAVAVGGALGALARWALGEAAPASGGLPWATLAINVSGSFLLGLLPGLPAVRRSPVLAAGLGPGLLGGFTTLSAYAEESRALLEAGRVLLAAAYVVATPLACVAAVAVAASLRPPAADPEST